MQAEYISDTSGNVSGTQRDVLDAADGSRQQKWEVRLHNGKKISSTAVMISSEDVAKTKSKHKSRGL